jgi:glycine/D-amino acid oxidase-like deaminating enzyme
MGDPDVVVIGAGHNGLVWAAYLAARRAPGSGRGAAAEFRSGEEGFGFSQVYLLVE